jgi:hypothetical protein
VRITQLDAGALGASVSVLVFLLLLVRRQTRDLRAPWRPRSVGLLSRTSSTCQAQRSTLESPNAHGGATDHCCCRCYDAEGGRERGLAVLLILKEEEKKRSGEGIVKWG